MVVEEVVAGSKDLPVDPVVGPFVVWVGGYVVKREDPVIPVVGPPRDVDLVPRPRRTEGRVVGVRPDHPDLGPVVQVHRDVGGGLAVRRLQPTRVADHWKRDARRRGAARPVVEEVVVARRGRRREARADAHLPQRHPVPRHER